MHLPSHKGFEHETGEGEKMQTFKGQGKARVVAGKAAKRSKPSNGALHNPTFGKQAEAMFGVGKFETCKWMR